MATSGAYGLYKNGVSKIASKRYDAYPDMEGGLGVKMLNAIKEFGNDKDKLDKLFDKVEIVDPDEFDYGERDGFFICDSEVKNIKIPDGKFFLNRSLWCKWAYIINLDKMVLEVYGGLNWNSKAQKGNRYHSENMEGYKEGGVELYPVMKLCEFKMDKMPDEDVFGKLCRAHKERAYNKNKKLIDKA